MSRVGEVHPEMESTLASKVEGEDIVSSVWKHTAVHKRTARD